MGIQGDITTCVWCDKTDIKKLIKSINNKLIN